MTTSISKTPLKPLFASTARGFEELLKNELEALGATETKIVQGGVSFMGDNTVMYNSLLWSRLASRILMPLAECNVYSDLDLYLGAQSIDWSQVFDLDKTFSVHFNGVNEEIRNSQYGAQRVKDAIVDSFMRTTNERPTVAKQHPDVRISVNLQKNSAVISLDLSGEGLHQRGYRDATGAAPLKETLASAILMRSGWDAKSPLLDPMCGSGTLLIEGAMMACDMAPGLNRHYWGFFGWLQHDEVLWQKVYQQARLRAREGVKAAKEANLQLFGYDIDGRVLELAKVNARRANVSELITFAQQDVTRLNNPLPEGPVGTVISNPPYGERLDSEPALIALHNVFGRIMKSAFGGWSLSLFSASPELLSCLQLRADRQFKAKNGPLDCVQKNYQLAINNNPINTAAIADDFANRLRKNVKKFEKWANKEGVACYRVYDADLPEYNVAIDLYEDYVVVQEYAPPKTVDENKARQRLFDIISATLAVLGVAPNQLVLKTRQRQKGKNQYEKMAQKGEFLQVNEFNAKFWVNLTDYLDTGLFLDHRIARRMLGEMSRGKDFLNLFAYTGTATVHAGLGGARSTTTVDMSRTYLEWAEKNLQLNDLSGRQHRLIQADCLGYLREVKEQFDLIFIDPPTFSNSKRMENTFDVQRDHIDLMQDLKRILRPGGTIMFSNNKRGFKMDAEGMAQLGLSFKSITEQTLSQDFARNKQIHNCWLITHAA